jgi:3-hydroxybutyryl-CoA dehydratase
MPAAYIVDTSTPANVFTLSDLTVGDRCVERWRIDDEASEAFVYASNDMAPVHHDDGHAASLGFSRRIVHGMLASARFSRLLGMFLPGSGSVIMNVNFDYLQPVHVNDTLECAVTITHVTANGVVRLECTAHRGDDLCVRGRATCLLRTS